MNERIKELEMQALRESAPTFYQEHFMEKFAELIVQECIEQVITGPNGPAYYAVEAAVRVKNHFGVK
jgi:hypothetical protein